MKDSKKMLKFVLLWFFGLLLATIVFTFCHECGHGLGAKLEGIKVSTGFNRVGNSGMKPKDPGFRKEEYVSGAVSLDGFMGPLVNWTLAIISIILMITKTCKKKKTKFIVSLCAISNAWIRFGPMLWVLCAALTGHVHMEDEVQWFGNSVPSLQFPMTDQAFRNLTKVQPEVFLSQPLFYLWPMISFIVSLICMIIAFKYIYQYFKAEILTTCNKVVIAVSPILVTPFWFLIINHLDNIIRINW